MIAIKCRLFISALLISNICSGGVLTEEQARYTATYWCNENGFSILKWKGLIFNSDNQMTGKLDLDCQQFWMINPPMDFIFDRTSDGWALTKVKEESGFMVTQGFSDRIGKSVFIKVGFEKDYHVDNATSNIINAEVEKIVNMYVGQYRLSERSDNLTEALKLGGAELQIKKSGSKYLIASFGLYSPNENNKFIAYDNNIYTLSYEYACRCFQNDSSEVSIRLNQGNRIWAIKSKKYEAPNITDYAVYEVIIPENSNSATSNSIPALNKRLREEVYDFGGAKQGQMITHTFYFENPDVNVISPSKISSSCNCLTTKFKKGYIWQGHSSPVQVTFDTNGRSGNQDLTITIIYEYNKDGVVKKNASKVFHIKGEITQ